MKLKIFLILTIVAFLYSCKDDDEAPVVDVTPLPTPTEEIIEISTAHGKMIVWLYKETPLHRENFLKLTTVAMLFNLAGDTSQSFSSSPAGATSVPKNSFIFCPWQASVNCFASRSATICAIDGPAAQSPNTEHNSRQLA